MSLKAWYFKKLEQKSFKITMAILIAPIVYTAGVGAVFVQLFKNIWTCFEDCWYSVGGTVSDINRYYRTNVFATPAPVVEEDV
jgi:hypothetical protein